MRIFGVLLAISLLGLSVCASADDSFNLKNNTSYYLFAKDAGAGCPAKIAPGETAAVHSSWCGFVACATSSFSDDQGCLEYNSDKSALTQGGYATYFSISFYQQLCTVPEGNHYQCKYENGTYTLDYLSVIQKYSAGSNTGLPVELATPANYSTNPMYRGINVSGLEYDGTFLDAMYQLPDKPDIQYFIAQGMNTIRLPIRWEFLLATQKNNSVDLITSVDPSSTALNDTYITAVHDILQKYLQSGVNVILDLHNYMRFCPTGADVGQANEPTDPVTNHCQLMNSQQLAYIWGVLSDKFGDLAQQYPQQLIFGLMNEPNTMDGQAGQELNTQDLFNAEVAALQQIRKHGLNNMVLLSGNYWDPLHGWVAVSPSSGNAPNGSVFTADNLAKAGITDLSHVAVEMHQYFDSDYSGRSSTCNQYASYDAFLQSLQLQPNSANDLSAWMKKNHMKAFLTEFGAADNAICQQDLNYILQYVNQNAYNPQKPNDGGFMGWTVWRANRHGNTGFSPFNYLQQADYTVYGATGSPYSSPEGTGIVQGPGNGLMTSVFANYLSKVQ